MNDIVKQVDPWHYLGGHSMINEDRKKIIDHLVSILPLREFETVPIYVGWTGYIEGEKELKPDGVYRTVDPVGRNVFIINDMLYFQRYVLGTCIMKGPLKRRIFNDCMDDSDWEFLKNL